MKSPRLILPIALAAAAWRFAAPDAFATVTVLAHYRMGEVYPGAGIGNTVVNPILNTAGSNPLSPSGAPSFASASPEAALHAGSSLAIHFDGANQWLAGDLLSTLTDNFGIEFWAKPDSDASSPRIIAYNGNTSSSGWGVFQDGANYVGLLGGVAYVGSGPAASNTWAHVALVRNAGVTTLYVNGQPYGSSAALPNVPSGFFAIARHPQSPAGEFFAGAVDELRVFTFPIGQFSTNDLLLNLSRPANDDFANAIPLTGSYSSQLINNTDATKEAGEPDHAGNFGGHSIWYSYLAQTNTHIAFGTVFTSFNSVLAVYTGRSVDALTLVASNDDIGIANVDSRVTFQTQSGQRYYIAVDGFDGQMGGGYLFWNISPPNDNFADAMLLPGSRGTVTMDSYYASPEPGEPAHGSPRGDHSLWFRFASPTNANVVFGTSGSAFDTVMAIYTGTNLASLTMVATNDNASTNVYVSQIELAVVAGQTYYIAVDGHNEDSGVVTLCWSAGLPPNDNFASALELPGGFGTTNSWNFLATKELNEPDHATNAGGASLWYTFTPQASGPISIATLGSSFDTTLAVYTGASLGALTLVASDDDVDTNIVQSAVQFTGVGGQQYRIAVDGFDGDNGYVSLQWGAGVPANDDFENAIPLAGAHGQTSAQTFHATKQSGEPDHAGNPGGHSIWFTLTAPNTGPVTVSTWGSSFDTVLAVYTGTTVGTLSLIATNDDAFAMTYASKVSWLAAAGQMYSIAVDGFDGENGIVSLAWDQFVSPPVTISKSGRDVLVNWPEPFRIETTTNLSPSAAWTPSAFAPPALFSGSTSNAFFRAVYP